MTITRFPYNISKEEDARQAKIAEEVAANFKAELAAVLEKYQASIDVREVTHGYTTSADGFEVDFEGIYSADCEVVRPYFSIKFGMSEDAKSIKE